MTEFMGKKIEVPLIASSSCITENKAGLEKLYKAGIRMAILKSCADYERLYYTGKREFSRDNHTGYLYASSPFEKEILTLDEATLLMNELATYNDFYLLPSITAASIDEKDWVDPCVKFCKMGATGIQLDFFYAHNLIGTPDFKGKLIHLLKTLQHEVSIPIMPKLNVNLPKDFIIPILAEAGIQYVSLLDSVRSPYFERIDGRLQLSKRLNVEATSCFGAWQLPLTLGYTYTASKYGLKVCAGGGITCSEDVEKLFAAGAHVVQSASFLTKSPSKYKELLKY